MGGPPSTGDHGETLQDFYKKMQEDQQRNMNPYMYGLMNLNPIARDIYIIGYRHDGNTGEKK